MADRPGVVHCLSHGKSFADEPVFVFLALSEILGVQLCRGVPSCTCAPWLLTTRTLHEEVLLCPLLFMLVVLICTYAACIFSPSWTVVLWVIATQLLVWSLELHR